MTEEQIRELHEAAQNTLAKATRKSWEAGTVAFLTFALMIGAGILFTRQYYALEKHRVEHDKERADQIEYLERDKEQVIITIKESLKSNNELVAQISKSIESEEKIAEQRLDVEKTLIELLQQVVEALKQ